MKTNRLTTNEYWNQKYGSNVTTTLTTSGFQGHTNKQILEQISSIGLHQKSIIEIGAGGSQWLPFLAKQYPDSSFTGLDYAKAGCKELKDRAKIENVDITVVNADLFQPPKELIGKFDILISFGVVEHFDNLSETVKALSVFLKPTGTIFTIIPNMNGSIGYLTRKLNKDVYDLHNPHDLASLKKGHEDAGVIIKKANYLCSTEFGVLSACINHKSNAKAKFTYLWLSRLTKFISIFELKLLRLPASRLFSPFIYCITEIKS